MARPWIIFVVFTLASASQLMMSAPAQQVDINVRKRGALPDECLEGRDIAACVKKAEAGNLAAANFVGTNYEYGLVRSFPKNDFQAARFYRIAAEQGHDLAQYSLGALYHRGRNVARNGGEAARWYRLAALQGHYAAQFNLGMMYLNGDGVPQNDGRACFWLNLVASGAFPDWAGVEDVPRRRGPRATRR